MTGAESRTRRPVLPKLRTPGARGHLIRVQSFFRVLRLRIAGSWSNPSGCSPAAEGTTGGPNVELVIAELRRPSLPLQDNLAGYSESDSR